MKQSVIRWTTTILLILSVSLSVVLSVALWSGNLKEGSEIGFVQPPAMPTASTPDSTHVIRPYRVTVNTNQGHTELPINSSGYAYWTNHLLHMHVHDVRSMTRLPKNITMKVTIHFGIPLTRSIGGRWLASFGSVLGSWSGYDIVLYELPTDNICHIAFVGSSYILSMRTDLNASDVSIEANANVENNEYTLLGAPSSPNYIPVQLQMDRLVYTVRHPDQIPIVHTFFVNPQAITRIEQDSHTVLWTDGSRAVQWDTQNRELRYQDPNGEQPTLHNDTLSTALDFIHTHGGGAQNVIAFDDVKTLTTNPFLPTYSFTQYVEGYPVLSSSSDYDVNLSAGRVVEYNRPTWVLQRVVKRKTLDIIGQKKLQAAIAKIDPGDPVSQLQITIGYAIVLPPAKATHQNQIVLEPVYNVQNSNGSSWMIDGSTGRLLSGGGQS